MKDSFILKLAVNELTQCVNQLAQKYNISPSLLTFVMSTVSDKVNELAIHEAVDEVGKLELKVAEMQSKSEESGTSETTKPVDVPTGKQSITTKSTSVRKSGTIDDLIKDLEANGVKVTQIRKEVTSDGTTEEIIEEGEDGNRRANNNH